MTRRFAIAASGSVAVVASVTATVFVLLVRLTALQQLNSVTEAVAGIGDLALVALALVAAIGWVMIASFATPFSALRWLAVVLVPVIASAQVWWPTAHGILRPEKPVAGRSLVVLTQNLWARNPDPDRTARRVVAEGADVVVLNEFTTTHREAFRRAGAMRTYPYQYRLTSDSSNGMAVMSRVPIIRTTRLKTSTNDVRVDLSMPGGEVHLFAVHPPAPTDGDRIRRRIVDLSEVQAKVCAAGPRVVVAGDFNSSAGHTPFRSLASACRLRDAADVAGAGIAATWPLERLSPPLMRLDHVLVGTGLGVAGIGLIPPSGSDHKGVRADLTVPV